MKTRKQMLWRFWQCAAGFLLLCGLISYIIDLTSLHPVHRIYSYTDPQCIETLTALDQNSLVLFDVDDTLTYAPDSFANVRKSDLSWWFWIQLLIKFPHLYKKAAQEDLASHVFLQAPRVLIEDGISELINSLRQRHITVLGLTNMLTGKLGIIPHAEEWRYSVLKELGVTFNTTYPDTTFKTVREYTHIPKSHSQPDPNVRCMPQSRGNYPTLHKGLLCTNQTDKGTVLGAFLDYAKIKPSMIVFFDDMGPVLQEVGDVCAARGIPCKLFLYRRVELLSQTFCATRTFRQLDHLIRTGVWLGDAEADATLPQEEPNTAGTHTPDPAFCQ